MGDYAPGAKGKVGLYMRETKRRSDSKTPGRGADEGSLEGRTEGERCPTLLSHRLSNKHMHCQISHLDIASNQRRLR